MHFDIFRPHQKPQPINLDDDHTIRFDEQGNTAVYLQYAHARICSILQKANKDIEELKTVSLSFYFEPTTTCP